MANINSTAVANWVPQWWASKAQVAVEFAQVVAPRVNHEYEGQVKGYGDRVTINTVANYRAQDKAADTDVTFDANTTGKVTLTVNKHKYSAVRIEKFAEKQAMPGFRAATVKKLSYPLARVKDTDLTALFDGFADNGTIGTLGTELTENDYFTAWTKLAEAGVLEDGEASDAVSIFLSPAALAAMLKLNLLNSRDYNPNANAMTRASIGDYVMGGKVLMTNLLESDAAGQHDCAFMHKDALAMAEQMEVEVLSDLIIEAISTAIVAHTSYGVVELTRPVEGAGALNVTLTDSRGVYLATV